MAGSEFAPNGIPKFSVVRLRYKFEGDAVPVAKLFVVIGHVKDHVLCLKATSQVDIYKNNAAKMAGAVHYAAGSMPCFPDETIIQPDNPFPIPHTDIVLQHKKGTFAIVGAMPTDFHARLVGAIKASVTISPVRMKNLLGTIG